MFQAYSIPLTDNDFVALGKLTAIIGQIDEEMVQTVCRKLKVKRAVGDAIMGSTKTSVSSSIWKRVVEGSAKRKKIGYLVDHAMAEIKAVSEGRNNFIHAVFYEHLEPGAYTYSTTGEYVELQPDESVTTKAHRVKGGKRTPISELKPLVERAARLSCLVAHIAWLVAPAFPKRKSTTSPWHNRLLPTLPPRPSRERPRKTKVRGVR
jgi:hypothetical protein